MWHNIDIFKLFVQLLPTFLRTTRIQALLRSMATPLMDLANQFSTFRQDTVRKVGSATISVIMLEKLLNDEFLYVENDIFITDPATEQKIYIYPAITGAPLVVSSTPVRIHSAGLSGSDTDFIINIPNEIDSQTSRQSISKITEYYKMPGKTYKIVSYE